MECFMVLDDSYTISFGANKYDLIKLFHYYDIVTVEFLYYLESVLGDDFLKNIEINSEILHWLKTTMWTGTMDDYYIENNHRFLEWAYTDSLVNKIKIGYIDLSGNKIIVINGIL